MWGVLSQEAQDIIALQAELKQEQDSNLKLAKEVRDKAALESKSADASSDEKGTKKNDKPAWMKSPPKDDEPKSKTMNGETFHWCSHHKACGTHSEQDCRLGKARSTEGGTETTTDSQAVINVAKQAHSPDFIAYSALMEHLRQATACQADLECWLSPAWCILLHGLCAMARPTSIYIHLLYLCLTFIPWILHVIIIEAYTTLISIQNYYITYQGSYLWYLQHWFRTQLKELLCTPASAHPTSCFTHASFRDH